MPVWMAKGIPAVDKGKEFGFESSEPEKNATEGLPAALEKEPKGPAGK